MDIEIKTSLSTDFLSGSVKDERGVRWVVPSTCLYASVLSALYDNSNQEIGINIELLKKMIRSDFNKGIYTSTTIGRGENDFIQVDQLAGRYLLELQRISYSPQFLREGKLQFSLGVLFHFEATKLLDILQWLYNQPRVGIRIAQILNSSNGGQSMLTRLQTTNEEAGKVFVILGKDPEEASKRQFRPVRISKEVR